MLNNYINNVPIILPSSSFKIQSTFKCFTILKQSLNKIEKFNIANYTGNHIGIHKGSRLNPFRPELFLAAKKNFLA